MDNALLQQEKQRKEQFARITAPLHVTQNRFSEHKQIEGYHENQQLSAYFGCDRLMKMDSPYGTIQMGYNPRKGQSFLFANIKTSIFDTAASREQHELSEQQQMGEIKTGNQNRAFVARRRQDSAVVLFKAENKPWSELSLSPYLNRVHTGALHKALPFLGAWEQLHARNEAAQQQRTLQQQEHDALQEHDAGTKLRGIRAARVNLCATQNELGALVVRKQQRSLWFFRRVNLIFDLQKQKMFEYYRGRMVKCRLEAEHATLPPQDTASQKKP